MLFPVGGMETKAVSVQGQWLLFPWTPFEPPLNPTVALPQLTCLNSTPSSSTGG
jgi:hypothetical protein